MLAVAAAQRSPVTAQGMQDDPARGEIDLAARLRARLPLVLTVAIAIVLVVPLVLFMRRGAVSKESVAAH